MKTLIFLLSVVLCTSCQPFTPPPGFYELWHTEDPVVRAHYIKVYGVDPITGVRVAKPQVHSAPHKQATHKKSVTKRVASKKSVAAKPTESSHQIQSPPPQYKNHHQYFWNEKKQRWDYYWVP